MRPQFHVTYEITTPESAEHGDCAERGFMTPREWRYPMSATDIGARALSIKNDQAVSFRQAIDLISQGSMRDDGRCFTEEGERLDYRTGAGEVRSLHVPDRITPSSYARIRRIVCGY